MTYFLDTNIISYLLKGSINVKYKITNLLLNADKIYIPAIAYYETKRGLLATSANKKLSILQNFVSTFGIVDITTKTLDIASENWASLKTKGLIIEDSDLLIGASAIENDAILITNNANHLSRLKNIKVEVWEY